MLQSITEGSRDRNQLEAGSQRQELKQAVKECCLLGSFQLATSKLLQSSPLNSEHSMALSDQSYRYFHECPQSNIPRAHSLVPNGVSQVSQEEQNQWDGEKYAYTNK